MFKFMFLLMEVFHYVLNRSSNGNILLNGGEVFIYIVSQQEGCVQMSVLKHVNCVKQKSFIDRSNK
jgi:hypothetical protein